MRKISVESTYISSIGYDDHTSTLEIEFKNAKTFQYDKVPPEVFDAFRAAESKGRYFRAEIKGKYEGTEVENFA